MASPAEARVCHPWKDLYDRMVEEVRKHWRPNLEAGDSISDLGLSFLSF